MKELTIEQKAKAYDKVREKIDLRFGSNVAEEIFSEFEESEDEKIRKAIIKFIKVSKLEWENYSDYSSWIAWLDKQGNTNETVNRDEFAQGVLRGAAINLITWIDYNAAEDNMCLSNMECKDIEDALVSSDWNKIYAYMKKKLEKQDKSATIDIDKMVNEYANNNECGNEEFGKPVNCMIRAYRQGINDTLNLSLGIEKQGKQKPTLEDAAKLFLEALSETPYNNTPIVEAQIITKQLLTFLSDPKAYNPNAINEQKPADKVEPKFKEE